MTEDEWLSCEDWRPMLAFLSGRLSQRKARLFVCAGLRCFWDSYYDDFSRRGYVPWGERATYEMATEDEIRRAEDWAEWSTVDLASEAEYLQWDPAETGKNCPSGLRLTRMRGVSGDYLQPGERIGAEQLRYRRRIAAWLVECDRVDNTNGGLRNLLDQDGWPKGWLVREIVGNPFRPASIDPAWLIWHDGTVSKIASGIYDERAFDRLPILADALEDAGCDNAAMLAHCRGPGPHVRGCWVVDLLLGKE